MKILERRGGWLMKIGFFDSGMGGLSVLIEAMKQFPEHDYYYYADSLRAPYGVKSREDVKDYCEEIVSFLLDKEVELIVVACNTATNVAIDFLRERFHSIPIIGVEPAIKPALELTHEKNKRILVTATPLTLKEEKFLNRLDQLGGKEACDLLPLPRLVSFAEERMIEQDEVLAYLKEQLEPFVLSDYQIVVLGCTHFPFFKEAFKQLFGQEIMLIDGSIGTVKRMGSFLKKWEFSDREPSLTFYISGVEQSAEQVASILSYYRSHY